MAGGTSGAVRAGRAFVELFTDSSKMTRGLKSAEKDFRDWGGKIRNVGLGVSAGGAAIAAPMFLATTAFADAGSELNDMSAKTGESVESLSLLKFAAEQTGTNFEAVGKGVKGLDNKLADAVGGSKSAEAAFTAVGLSSEQLLNMSVEDQMAAIAEGLMKIQNPALRAAAAQDLFGKSGMELLPMLKDGAAGLKTLTDRGKEVGAGWTTAAAESADALGDRFDELKVTGMSLVFAVGGALAPAIMELSEPIFAIATATREWIAANPGVITTVAGVAAGAVAAGTAIAGLGITLTMVGAGFGGLAAAATAVMSPIGLVVGALTGIGYLIVTEADIGSEAFSSLSQTATTAWGGISDAIASGDIGLAAEIAVAGLNVVWTQGIGVLKDEWAIVIGAMQGVGEHFSAFMSSIWVDIKGFAFDAMNSIASKWDTVTGGLADVLIDVGVASGVIKGDANEIKATRREDTERRQAGRDSAVAAGMESRQKEKQSIEENKQVGLSGIELERDGKLLENEKAKVEAEGKLAELRQQAADQAEESKRQSDERKKTATPSGPDITTPAIGGDVKGAATFSGLASSMNRDYRTPASSDMFGAGSAAGSAASEIDPDTELLTSIRDTLQSLDGRVAAGGTMTA